MKRKIEGEKKEWKKKDRRKLINKKGKFAGAKYSEWECRMQEEKGIYI